MCDINAMLTDLFIQHHDALERYCKRLVHYDPKFFTLAEDCVQFAFLTALKHPDEFNNCLNKYGWLSICCKNYIMSKIRKHKNRLKILGRTTSFDECESVEDPIDAIIRWIDSSSTKEYIDLLYNSLSTTEKRIFADYYYRDYSLLETAKRNNVTIGSVRGAVQRIRNKAKNMKHLLNNFIMMIVHF